MMIVGRGDLFCVVVKYFRFSCLMICKCYFGCYFELVIDLRLWIVYEMDG